MIIVKQINHLYFFLLKFFQNFLQFLFNFFKNLFYLIRYKSYQFKFLYLSFFGFCSKKFFHPQMQNELTIILLIIH
jgi:predicted nucleotidyltransferase